MLKDAAITARRVYDRCPSTIIDGVLILLAIATGFAFAIHVVGFLVINPFDTSWLWGDPAHSQLGWAFFRHEPLLSFPLGWSHALGYPLGEPIAWLDCVPIVALLLWPLRNILPWDFQYLGLIFAINCVLQLYFGYRISWHLAGHSRTVAIAGALLFLVAPPFVFRAGGHFPLTSHWLILAALTLYFTANAAPTKWRIAGGAVLCFLAATIHAYLMVMVLLIDAGTHLRTALSSKEIAGASLRARLSWIALPVAISLASAIAGLIIFGLLRPLELRAYAEGGYTQFSMNLLAPIDPDKFGALLLKSQPQVGTLQYEGYNYLGLGVILLGTLALARRPSLFVRSLCKREAAATWIICVVSLLLALSLKATVGSRTIYDIHVPLPVFEALSAFRASGRFFWPAYYLILSGVIVLAFTAFGARAAALALFCALLIQLADTRSLYNSIRARWNPTSALSFTDGAEWQALRPSHAHLIVEPPWQCGDADTPAGRNGFWIFGNLAAKLNMTINSFFAGRLSSQQLEYFCRRQPSQIAHGGLAPDTAYVFSTANQVVSLSLGDHYCRMVDGVVLCTTDAGKEGLAPSLLNTIPVTPSDASVQFVPGSAGDKLLARGWSIPESWGRWSNGDEAVLVLRFADASRAADVHLSLVPFVLPGRVQRVEVAANGSPVARWHFTTADAQDVSFHIPPADIRPDGIVNLTFSLPDAASPVSSGLSADPRLLAFRLIALRINLD
jgi:hypothetical protein